MKLYPTICCLLVLPFAVIAQPAMDTALQRYSVWLQAHDTASTATIAAWVKTQDTSGRWPDVAYNDSSISNWQTTAHLARVRSMACQYLMPSATADTALKKALLKGVDYWLLKKYVNKNWWYNRIGVPQFWKDILTLAGQQLTPAQFDSGMALLRKYDILPNFTGANLTWSADLMLHDGLLSKDAEKTNQAVIILAKEIRVIKGEAIQPDYSFLQHGRRLQIHSYGSSFLKENIRLAWELQHTPWQFGQEKINILTDFILNGWQWMARGIHNTPASIDREISRVGRLHNADLRAFLPWYIEITAERKAELKALLAAQTGGPHPLAGFRYFPYGDFAAYQQKELSFFLKTISPHTEPAETINHENQKGGLLNFGNTYFIRTGKEYYDLMPVWDWKKLPGATVYKGVDTLQKSLFTGGVSNGSMGFAVMDVNASGGDTTRNINKLWAFCQGKMICLIAGINKNDSASTILDQCRLQGAVTVNTTAGVVKKGIHSLTNVRWLHHAGLAYIPIGKNKMLVPLKEAAGSWSSITLYGSREVIKEKVFMPVINHGSEGSTAYIVATANNPAQAARLAAEPGFSIVQNSKKIQCLLFGNGNWMAVIRSPAEPVQIGNNRVSANEPCLLMYDGYKVYAASPLTGGQACEVTIDGKKYPVSMPDDGSTVSFGL